jgi:hypothetical protein
VSTKAVREARTWCRQAESDLRTAQALLGRPEPMTDGDVRCHAAALCAQTVEKSLKGYAFLNGTEPAMNHRPDKYLSLWLPEGGRLLKHRSHHGHLSKLFDPGTKGAVRRLLDLTPGGLGNLAGATNTEYPWTEGGEWAKTPCSERGIYELDFVKESCATAKRILDTVMKLVVAVERTGAI